VAPGNENGLRLRVYGDKGGVEWSQEHPNQLRFAPVGQAPRILSRGGPNLGPAASRVTRIPSGHPEGYLEAFANLYRDLAEQIGRAARSGRLIGRPLLVRRSKMGARRQVHPRGGRVECEERRLGGHAAEAALDLRNKLAELRKVDIATGDNGDYRSEPALR